MATQKQKILIDTDPGQDIDDLLAIWFALLRPELDVAAITTVTWPTDQRARMIKRLLRHLGRSDIPVGAGMQLPLRRFSEAELRDQHNLARSMNHYAFAEPEDPQDACHEDAIDLILRTVEQNAGNIALLCIAPLTNIACALRRKPEIAAQIQYIALMGGETALNRREHNIAFDYIAADIVLSSGIPLFMGTWDITRRFILSKDDCARIAAGGSPLHAAIGKAIELWHPAQSWKPGPVMYDLFPIVHAMDRSYYTLTPMNVQVDTTGDLTRGMTVIGRGEANAQVTTDLRAAELHELYLDAVLSRG